MAGTCSGSIRATSASRASACCVRASTRGWTRSASAGSAATAAAASAASARAASASATRGSGGSGADGPSEHAASAGGRSSNPVISERRLSPLPGRPSGPDRAPT
ncbi:hypothetical protein BJF78_27520 [Pseudonocardia sp. CNS-139]|nr:hypothetical protein BJF78_27520 [Pseudonocardia sp. CNS-139]